MEKKEVDALLSDYFSFSSRSDDPELMAIAAALFVEQTFGIGLADDELTPAVLGTPEAIRRLVLARLETP